MVLKITKNKKHPIMSVYCEFIDLIIPISKIDLVYPGGFSKFKKERLHHFFQVCWNDDYLFREGAMSHDNLEISIKNWERLGLKSKSMINGQMQWIDMCEVVSLDGGSTLPCDWLEIDYKNRCVSLIGSPKGERIGPSLRK